MKGKIIQSVQDSLRSLQQLTAPHAVTFIEESAQRIARCIQQGGKVLVAGNGGSLCDAAHFAEELTGFFRKKRRALPAIAFSDPGHITCVSNDLGFDYVFSRAVEAFGKEGDIFVGLTTSGNSPNIVQAFAQAQELGLATISFLGRDGGNLKGVADLELIIDACDTSDRIQEAHMTAIHVIIELVEEILFGAEAEERVGSMVAAVSR